MTWLAAPFLNIPRWVWIAGAICILTALAIKIADNAVEDALETAKQTGVMEERATNLETTVKRVEIANEARDEIINDRGNARYEQCLRTARTPANCERLLRTGNPNDR